MSPKVIDRLSDVTRPTGEEDALAIAYPRISVSPRIALAAAAIVALVVGIIAVRALWLSDAPTPAVSAPAVAATTDSAGGEIVVSVVGAVRDPGLVTLVAGDRVADAIAAAGGLVGGADPAAINQAQLLVDGQQIVVPAAGASAASAASIAATVSLNSASIAELVTLDGVGDATAEAIISHREEIGGFTAIEQLLDVSGIGPVKFEKIKNNVTL